MAKEKNSVTQKSYCTCGHSQRFFQSGREGTSTMPMGLESSFVHLSMPPPNLNRYDSSPWIDSGTSAFNGGFLPTLAHSTAMVRAAHGKARGVTDDPGVFLCLSCIERVVAALDVDTKRLNSEALSYSRAVSEEEESQKKVERTVTNTAVWHDREEPNENSDMDVIDRTASAFHDEIAVLKMACEQHEQELNHLESLQREQALVARQLENIDDNLWDERNSLELEARAFDYTQTQLTAHATRAQEEVESLSQVRLHATLFDLVVDRRGLRYPLINELRLAYRPKGDVRWGEINAAWSQALQLVLFVGASIKFRSRDWRIVPLTTCAKLIYLSPDGKRRAVYTLGGTHDTSNSISSHSTQSVSNRSMAVSLKALNALLDQMIRHVMSTIDDPPHVPFDISRQRIGSYDLSNMQESNDSGWSRVIHCMACNLQWLSDRAADSILQEHIL